MSQLTLHSYALSIDGLRVHYSHNGRSTQLTLDPHATADLFVDAGFIEGFDTEARTGEPVILYIDNLYGRPVAGYCYWCDFVKTWPLCQRHFELLVEHKEQRRQCRRDLAVINHLLKPLRATA